jgi:predicted dehydrogenase
MSKIRVGLIGAGNMGSNHARVLSNIQDVEFIGVTDINHMIGSQLADRYNTDFFHSVDELLTRIDCVIIATPTQTHYNLAMKSISANLDILVEKPITPNLQEAYTIVDEINNRNLILQVGHIEHFNPAIQQLKYILQDEELIDISVQRLSPYNESGYDTDVIYDLMIHDIDIVLGILGRSPDTLFATGINVCSDNQIDYATAIFMYDKSVTVSITASRVTQEKIRRMTITTKRAYIVLDYMDRKITISRKIRSELLNHRSYYQENIVEKVLVPSQEPLFLQLEHFFYCVRKRIEPEVSGNKAIAALKMAEKIRNSINS